MEGERKEGMDTVKKGRERKGGRIGEKTKGEEGREDRREDKGRGREGGIGEKTKGEEGREDRREDKGRGREGG